MNPITVINQNCTWSTEYDEGSFCAILHERGTWERNTYWLLEWALLDLISKNEIREDTYVPVFLIFSATIGAISSHLDQNDLFEITNLNRDEVYEFRDRIQIVFQSFFTKRIPERDMFEEVNPLLPAGRNAFF